MKENAHLGKETRCFLSRIGKSKRNEYVMIKFYGREMESCRNFDQNALIFGRERRDEAK